jgi:apolipoprotein N-acyltransferase
MFFLLKACIIGLAATCAFPLVIEPLSPTPILEGLPRELLMVICATGLYVEIEKHQGWRLIYWLVIAMTSFGGLPMLQSIILLALLCLYCALYWACIPGLSLFLVKHLGLPLVLGFPTAIVFLEWLRTFVITGFPWGLWGYSQSRNIIFLQLASVVGVYGLSWLIAFFSALCGACLKSKTRKMRLRCMRYALLCLVGLYGLGALLLLSTEPPAGPALRVGLIQGNIEQTLKSRSSQYRRKIKERYLELSQTAIKAGANAIIWPEAAWPGHVRAKSQMLRGYDLEVDTIMGASTYLKNDVDGTNKLHNSAFFVDAGKISGRYDKLHLVPFGEYVPLRDILPVDKFVPGMLDYSPGQSHAPLNDTWGVLICYDGIFPEISREHVLAGATILVNLTNDAWYGVSSAPYQHRDFYALRAVETGRWLARSANTGISVFFDPKGRMLAPTRHNTSAITVYDVVPHRGQTFYVLLGNWVIALTLGLFLIAGLNMLSRKFKRNADAA